MNNVRFVSCSLVTDATLGIQRLSVGTTYLEGYMEEVNDRVLGMLNTPTPSQTMQPQFKLMFTPQQVYLASTNVYIDLYSAVTDGSLIKLTHYRHPKLKIWVAYPSVDVVYLVSAIRDADHLGSTKVVTLKEQAL